MAGQLAEKLAARLFPKRKYRKSPETSGGAQDNNRGFPQGKMARSPADACRNPSAALPIGRTAGEGAVSVRPRRAHALSEGGRSSDSGQLRGIGSARFSQSESAGECWRVPTLGKRKDLRPRIARIYTDKDS